MHLVVRASGGVYLGLGELQVRRQDEPLRADHVLLARELLLQPGQLLVGEAGAHAFGLSSLGLERVDSVTFRWRVYGEKKRKG